MSTDSTDDAAFTLELRKLPYEKRWNLLKPKLESLFYVAEVDQISRKLKQRWGFSATPRQCKYRFKSWGWKKTIPEKVKQAICVKALKRAARGKETCALYHGQVITPQRLNRSLKATASTTITSRAPATLICSLPVDQHQILGGYLPFGNSLLVNWRMPYGSKLTDPTLAWAHGSPVPSVQTPDNVEIRSPVATDGASPGSMFCSQNQASLTPIVLQQRSNMLFQGRLHELLRTLGQSEQMTLSTWLYEFWYLGFVTAQSWSKAPLQRTNKLLDFRNHSPAADSTYSSQNGSLTTATCSEAAKASMPSQQCCWTIHSDPNVYDPADEYEDSDSDMSDDEQSFPRHLYENLQSNEFSNFPEARLPIPVPEVARQITRDPSELALESVAFAIMGRNIVLLHQTLENLGKQNVDVAPIYPFHMAAAFLDGGKTCCLLFDVLCERIKGAAVTKERFVNEYGHTVLDSLLLTIIRSHTTVDMKDVDGTLGDGAVMPGQEVDVCGRWSADSPCFRAFAASGKSALPASWKHKFCHTSIQAVLHSSALLLIEYPTMRDLPSGLFKHQCFGCGQRLQLGPLHALVMTAFCLATAGIPGEDLFGVVSYYLALVAGGIPPLRRCQISTSQLLGLNSDVLCTHEEMTPYEMATAIGNEVLQSSSPKDVRVGWTVLTTITRIVEEAPFATSAAREKLNDRLLLDRLDSNSRIDDCVEDADSLGEDNVTRHQKYQMNCNQLCGDDIERPRFCDSPILGHIWAAVQAELANHRKVKETDGWLSEKFSMEALLESLMRGHSPDIGYIRQSMLLPYCRCGNFECSSYYGVVLRENIFREHSANFDESGGNWARSSFVGLRMFHDFC